MRQTAHLLGTAPEALDELRIVCRRSMQDLDRNLLIFDAIVGVPHRRHCPLADLAGQEVAVGQHQADADLHDGGAGRLEAFGSLAGPRLDLGSSVHHRRYSGRLGGAIWDRWRGDRRRRRRRNHGRRSDRRCSDYFRSQRRDRLCRRHRVRIGLRFPTLLRPVLQSFPQRAAIGVGQQKVGLFRTRQRTVEQSRHMRKVRRAEQVQFRRQEDLGVDLLPQLLCLGSRRRRL